MGSPAFSLNPNDDSIVKISLEKMRGSKFQHSCLKQTYSPKFSPFVQKKVHLHKRKCISFQNCICSEKCSCSEMSKSWTESIWCLTAVGNNQLMSGKITCCQWWGYRWHGFLISYAGNVDEDGNSWWAFWDVPIIHFGDPILGQSQHFERNTTNVW